MLHKNAVIGDIHYIQNWEPADATTRAAIVTAPADIGKVARQLDTGEFWLLRSVGVWQLLSDGTSVNASIAANTAAINKNRLNVAQNALKIQASFANRPAQALLLYHNY
jgi:hypothetical protein